HVALLAPALAAVESYGGATVVGDDEVAWIVRVDPEIMKVAVRAGKVLPRFAGVGRAQRRSTQNVDRVFVLGIDEQFDVIPGALDEAMIVRDAAPLLAAVLGNKKSTCFLV